LFFWRVFVDLLSPAPARQNEMLPDKMFPMLVLFPHSYFSPSLERVLENNTPNQRDWTVLFLEKITNYLDW
jgi:hypothetical protein